MAAPNTPLLSLYSNISFLIYGMALYEAGTSIQLYLKAFTKSRLTSAIFLLITIAVFSTAGSTFFRVVTDCGFNSADSYLGPAEYGLNVVQMNLMYIGSYAYLFGGTLRTRVLLGNFPKVLYFLYFLVGIQSLLSLVMICMHFSIQTFLFNAVNGPSDFPINAVGQANATVTSMAVAVHVVLANLLMISFLYPIFEKADKKLAVAVKEMIALSDVQKAIYLFVLAALVLGLGKVNASMSRSIVHLWLHTQNSQFLRLTYVNMGEILVKQRTSITPKPYSIVESSTVSSV